MVIALFPVPDDEFGFFGPLVREYFPDGDPDSPCERDAGDFDEDEYGPYYEKAAA